MQIKVDMRILKYKRNTEVRCEHTSHSNDMKSNTESKNVLLFTGI